MSTPGNDQVERTHDEQDSGEYTGNLSTSIKRYFHSSAFSDLTICTADQEFKVHKLIICGQSEYFSRMFSHNWKEVTENTIQLEEDDPRAIEAMIHFMYRFEYDSSGVSPMLFNVKVYQVGDKYAIPKLKERVTENFKKIIESCWKMDDFPTAIAEAYSTTPRKGRGLRDPLVNISLKYIDTLLKREDFGLVLEETLGFAADLVRNSDLNLHSVPSVEEYCGYHRSGCEISWGWGSSSELDEPYCPKCGRYQDRKLMLWRG